MNQPIAYKTASPITGIRSQFVQGINGLHMHYLEAGFESPGRPLLLLLHGFPELAYSWRKVMPALAAAGYHVVAPDQRGYGLTTGWSDDYDEDIEPFRPLNMVRDVLALVATLEYSEVAGVIGHDFGSPIAGLCALSRPDIFRSVVMMSAPFAGVPEYPTEVRDGVITPPPAKGLANPDLHTGLAALNPQRKHYQVYYTTQPANQDMLNCPQGLHDFLRAYYHVKSADWIRNKPHPLANWEPVVMAELPNYYVMQADETMAETAAAEMPNDQEIANNTWLTDIELGVYTATYGDSGFQGGLQSYRCTMDSATAADLRLFAGRGIEVPASFMSGASDWGPQQMPGALTQLETVVCSDYKGTVQIDGAGHWVQQEQPEAVVKHILAFLTSLS